MVASDHTFSGLLDIMHQFASLLSFLPFLVQAITIPEINGDAFISPFNGDTVTNVTGLVLAKGRNGIWIRSTSPDENSLTSEALYVYSRSVGNSLSVGDIISLNGQVFEYRSSAAYLYITEIVSPTNVAVISSNNTVVPIIIGEDTNSPPNIQYSRLDEGDVFSVPNNQSLISSTNPTLKPSNYGLDFWEHLSGELVTVKNPRAISRPNRFGDTWVVGSSWATTSKNKHGGLTNSDTGMYNLPGSLVITRFDNHHRRKPRGHHYRKPS